MFNKIILFVSNVTKSLVFPVINMKLHQSFGQYKKCVYENWVGCIFLPLVTALEVVTKAAQWLRCCAKNRKFAGSIPAGVSGIFR